MEKVGIEDSLAALDEAIGGLDAVGVDDVIFADGGVHKGARDTVAAKGMLHVDPVQDGRIGPSNRGSYRTNGVPVDLAHVVWIARHDHRRLREQARDDVVVSREIDRVRDAGDGGRIAVGLQPRVVNEGHVGRFHFPQHE